MIAGDPNVEGFVWPLILTIVVFAYSIVWMLRAVRSAREIRSDKCPDPFEYIIVVGMQGIMSLACLFAGWAGTRLTLYLLPDYLAYIARMR